MKIRIANWNLQWARRNTPNGEAILRRLFQQEPEIICLTEADIDFLPKEGFSATSDADYGYESSPWKRKVILWSRKPWLEVDAIGDDSLPGGRYVSAVTETSLGPIRFIGVCIPWSAAHVTTGRKDRERWEDHLAYLCGLAGILEGIDSSTVVLGDFNQRIPRKWTPLEVHQALQTTFEGRLEFATTGLIQKIDKQAIDHVAHTGDFVASNVRSIDNIDSNGRELSDHFGVVLDLERMTET
jgi:hypothetical protein